MIFLTPEKLVLSLITNYSLKVLFLWINIKFNKNYIAYFPSILSKWNVWRDLDQHNSQLIFENLDNDKLLDFLRTIWSRLKTSELRLKIGFKFW